MPVWVKSCIVLGAVYYWLLSTIGCCLLLVAVYYWLLSTIGCCLLLVAVYYWLLSTIGCCLLSVAVYYRLLSTIGCCLLSIAAAAATYRTGHFSCGICFSAYFRLLKSQKPFFIEILQKLNWFDAFGVSECLNWSYLVLICLDWS